MNMHTYLRKKEREADHQDLARKPKPFAKSAEAGADHTSRSAYDIARGINISSDGFVDNVLRQYDITSPSRENRPTEQAYPWSPNTTRTLWRESQSTHGSAADAHTASPATESKIDSMRKSGGMPLDNSTREFMESRMGYDFSDVRIHTGPDAESTSKDLHAKAYTVGNDIAFNTGEYQPGSNEGKKLIAHELTHTVQQGAVRRKTEHAATSGSEEVIRKTAKPGVIQRRALKGWRLQKATEYNRKKHKFTDGLAYRLYQISGDDRLYNRAVAYARRRLGTRRVRGVTRTNPGHAGIGDDFTRLVASVQRKLPMRAHGWLNWATRNKAKNWKRTASKPKPKPKSTLGKIAQYTLDGAIWLIKKIPDWWFLPTGVIGLLFKHGAIGFLREFAKQGGDAVMGMAWRIAKALASWSCVKNYVISFVKAFFVDGLWGTLKLIWQIIKLPYTIGKFAWSIAKFIGNLNLGRTLRTIKNGLVSAAGWILKNGVNLVDGIKNMANRGNKKGVADFLQDLYTGAVGMLRKGGAKLAGYLIKFFKKDSKESGAAMGRTVGRFGGSIIFDVLLGVATAGGSAAFSAIARIIRPVFGWLSRTGKRAVSIAQSVAKKIWSLTQIISAKVLGWVGGVSKPLKKKLRFVVIEMRRFFRKLTRGIKRRKRSPAKPGKMPDKSPADMGKKAKELPKAVAEAKAVTEANDKINTPVSVLKTLLWNRFKPRYRWIREFVTPRKRQPGHYRVIMRAPLDEDYSTGSDKEMPKEIKFLHPESSLNKSSLEYWGTKTNDEIITSLKPGSVEPLMIKSTGVIMQGNTRIMVLKKRGVDIYELIKKEFFSSKPKSDWDNLFK